MPSNRMVGAVKPESATFLAEPAPAGNRQLLKNRSLLGFQISKILP